MKTCGVCKKDKKTTEFNAMSKAKDKLAYACRECITARDRQSYSRIKSGGKIYLSSSGKAVDSSKTYFISNCKICDKEFYQHSAQHLHCAECKIIMDKARGCLNPGKTKYKTKRKCSLDDVIILARRYAKAITCFYCKRSFTETNSKSYDHIVPCCLGGDSSPANINISCAECNRSKAWLPLDRWIDLCKRVCETNKVILEP